MGCHDAETIASDGFVQPSLRHSIFQGRGLLGPGQPSDDRELAGHGFVGVAGEEPRRTAAGE